MESCFCERLYDSVPVVETECAFSGSLCRIRQFETVDESRYCLTIFSLSDYKHVHFPHEEYQYLIKKLYVYLSPNAIWPTRCAAVNHEPHVSQLPFQGDLKIKFGVHRLALGPITTLGLVKSAPFTYADVFSINETRLKCDSKWDICTCGTCPVFNRLIDYESKALKLFAHRKMENVFLFPSKN